MTRRRWLLAALFLLHALPFLTRPALIGGDEPHYALMAYSLAVDHDTDLVNNYEEVEAGSPAAGRKFAGRQLERHLIGGEGGLTFSHPLGLPALAAAPLAMLHLAAPAAAPDLVLGLLGLVLTFLALIAGYRLLLDLGLDPAASRFLIFALYFATPLWFYSRLFFTEAYSWSLAVLTIYLLSRGRWRLASLALGVMFLIKEPNILIILPILIGVGLRFGAGRALRLSLGPAAALATWLAKNLYLHGEPLRTFQPYVVGDPVAGMVGLLFDSQHGLLPFAPILAVALLAAIWRPRPRQGPRDLELLALAAFTSTFLVVASWVAWRGGSCYGPRLLLPVVPALALPLVAVWKQVGSSAAARTALALLATVGFTIQWMAALDPFAAFWEISVGTLLSGKPVALLVGLALGLAITWRLTTASVASG